MFGLGATEIALIAVLALMLFPPRDLPKIARSVARVYGRIRRMADDFRRTVLEDSELSEPIREIRSAYYQSRHELRRIESEARKEVLRVRDAAQEMTNALRGDDDGDDEASAKAVQVAPTAAPDAAAAASVLGDEGDGSRDVGASSPAAAAGESSARAPTPTDLEHAALPRLGKVVAGPPPSPRAGLRPPTADPSADAAPPPAQGAVARTAGDRAGAPPFAPAVARQPVTGTVARGSARTHEVPPRLFEGADRRTVAERQGAADPANETSAAEDADVREAAPSPLPEPTQRRLGATS